MAACLPGFVHCWHRALQGSFMECVRCCWCAMVVPKGSVLEAKGHQHGKYVVK